MAVAALVLAGCGTTSRFVQDKPVSPKAMAEAQAYVANTTKMHDMVYRISEAAADECMRDRFRSPFTLMYNVPWVADEELRTAIYRVSGANEYPILLAHTPEARPYQGKRIKEINGTSMTNMHKGYRTLLLDADDKGDLALQFDDGQSVTLKPAPVCPANLISYYRHALDGPSNFGEPMEIIPQAWIDLSANDDELAFVIGRSIYFTGSEGRNKLNNAWMAGAAPNGLLIGLTFGLSGLVVDMKKVALTLRRKMNWRDADAFSVRAMVAAGFAPRAALSFAERSMHAADWPSAAEELKFDQDRFAALSSAVDSAVVKPPKPVHQEATQAPPMNAPAAAKFPTPPDVPRQ